MDIMSYVRPELLVVAVVLYFLGMWLKQAAFIKDKYIPLVLGIVGIFVCGIYVASVAAFATVQDILSVTKDIHVIRDATRGGVGTVLYEIAEQSKTGIRLNAEAIPVQDSVKGVCGMLGLEPLYLACEGRLVIFAPKEYAEEIVAKLREGKYSTEAAIIGEVTEEMPGRVVVTTEIGAETLLPPPGGELLPRIC